MNTPSHNFVAVDVRGLKAALVALAQADRVSVSVLVRGAVARDLGVSVEGRPPLADTATDSASSATSVKLSIRMPATKPGGSPTVRALRTCRGVRIWPASLPTCPCCRPAVAALSTSRPWLLPALSSRPSAGTSTD